MSSVLVIVTQSNLKSLAIYESLSAIMVLATFGCEVKVLLQDAGLSLLKSELQFNGLKHAYKHASNLLDGFEFYDLTPILVQNKDKNAEAVTQSTQELAFIEFNNAFIQSFDHVLYW
ncbi:hypothetical protein [Acinetobacter larvae]|uniref:Sulfurtransferase TusC n=1 Tax=Acinetobacter larvae TaxID=1789224 RepID=A0A1B2M0Y0_9GAMM|nr:hypothetical protein [Acinetobacter larvae]AOA58673.1 hypothetical protein BFG52_10115 [Acinetobacter larvae]